MIAQAGEVVEGGGSDLAVGTIGKLHLTSARPVTSRAAVIDFVLESSIVMNDSDFEWDDAKNAANFDKHGVTFERARLVFNDTCGVGQFDDRGDYGEDRFTLVGMVDGTLLFVAYVERGDLVRIISARRASRHEQNDYFQQNIHGP